GSAFVHWYAELMWRAGFDPVTAAEALAALRGAVLADVDEGGGADVVAASGFASKAVVSTPPVSLEWGTRFAATLRGGRERRYRRALDHILDGLEARRDGKVHPAS